MNAIAALPLRARAPRESAWRSSTYSSRDRSTLLRERSESQCP